MYVSSRSLVDSYIAHVINFNSFQKGRNIMALLKKVNYFDDLMDN